MYNTRAANQVVVLEHDGATGNAGAVPHILCRRYVQHETSLYRLCYGL